MEKIREIFGTLLTNIKEDIVDDMRIINDINGITLSVLDAYNRYQNDERGGVDYIFCIADSNDVICCLEGGLTTKEFALLYDECTRKTPYFLFGQNYTTPVVFKDTKELKEYLIANLDAVLHCALRYHQVNEYEQLVDRYFSMI